MRSDPRRVYRYLASHRQGGIEQLKKKWHFIDLKATLLSTRKYFEGVFSRPSASDNEGSCPSTGSDNGIKTQCKPECAISEVDWESSDVKEGCIPAKPIRIAQAVFKQEQLVTCLEAAQQKGKKALILEMRPMICAGSPFSGNLLVILSHFRASAWSDANASKCARCA